MSLKNLANFEVISLLPGLVTYVIVHLLSSRTKKMETVDAILIGLTYTLIIQGIWHLLKASGSLIPTPDVVGTTLIAMVLGLVLSVLINHGIIYNVLRSLKITTQPQWRSIWETSFRSSETELDSWVILELNNGRRIMGYVIGYSGEREDGHVCLKDPRWLNDSDENSVDEQTPIDGWFLTDNSQIVSVHFLPKPKLEKNENEPETDSSTATGTNNS